MDSGGSSFRMSRTAPVEDAGRRVRAGGGRSERPSHGRDPARQSLRASRGGIEGMGGTQTRKAGSLSATRTVHARRTVMRGGVLMSVPFKTSSKPFKPAIGLHGDAFGASRSMVNDNTRTMSRSSAAASFSAVASMSAGSSRKTPMPYHPNAARNRLRQEFKRMPRPSETTMKLSSGVPAVARQAHPYMTTSRFAQRQVGKPVQNRLGFTNPGIMAEFTRQSHKARLDA